MARNTNKHTLYLILLFYGLGVVVHALVLARAIPYDWVNGGNSSSYATQAVQSLVSMIVLAALALFCKKLLTTTRPLQKWQRYLVYALTAFWAVGLALQLMGTDFEKFGMSVVLSLGIVAHIRMARELRE